MNIPTYNVLEKFAYLRMIKLLNRVKTTASKRLHNEPDLQSFTEKHPSFISADIGLLIIEILGNPNEQTADYRVLATNSEFEKLSQTERKPRKIA